MRFHPINEVEGKLADEFEATCDNERCNRKLYRYRGDGSPDITCDCGAIYNSFGQRLRDDLYSRPNRSEWDDDIDDMQGYEAAYANYEGDY